MTTSGEVALLSARLERLHKAGLSGTLALAAAEERKLDLHELEKLIARGCDPTLALRIVWPLEESYDPDQGLHDQGDQSLPDLTK